jgi:PAS domain S-box-containing protein
MLAGVPDAVLMHDAAAFILDANEEACRSLGYSREELVGRHVRDVVEGLDGAMLANIVQVMKDRGVAMFRATHRRKDGTTFPVETRLALLRGHGPPVVISFARDLSGEEAERRAVRDSEAWHWRLLDLLPDGVVTYANGRITYANPAAARLVGASRPHDLVGRPVLDWVHPDSRATVRARMERVARGENVPLADEMLLKADGAAFAAEVAAAPLGSGEVLIVVRDLTDRRRGEEERAALLDRLRQAEKLEALGTLAGGVAHDFNNVLAAILGHAGALATDLPAGSVWREDAEQIAAAARRAKGVVQQILAFARRRPAEMRPVDVATAIREDVSLVRAATPANVEIALRLAPDAGAVRADPTQIHQVLLNLCTNARDAMEERGGMLVIAVEPARAPCAEGPAGLAPGAYVRIAVTDTGHGMDTATRARAFEPYFTTKTLGRGSGLGLSVVHGIATALGGAAMIDSDPGTGSTVQVWLPRIAETAAAAPPPRSPAVGRGRILLVDDDPIVSKAIRRMLESLGYDVTACGGSIEALERFRAAPDDFDAVLTDQTLPRMSGDRLTRELIAIRPKVPVIICTGYSERLDEERAREIGARFLMKPLDLAQLGDALLDALHSRTRAAS